MNDLANLLRRAAQHAEQTLSLTVSTHGVTGAEWRVLRDLYAGPAAPSMVADRLGLTRGAVTKLVDRLRAKRLLVRAAAGRDDRRFQSLALTGTGARLVAELRSSVDVAEAGLFSSLDPIARAALTDALTTLTEFRGAE